MKRSLCIALLVLTTGVTAFPQEEPLIPPKRGNTAKVGAVGGFTTQWLFMDAAPVNTFLTGAGAASLNTGGVFLYGGAGSAYIMIVKNLRVGGIGMSGSISSSSLDQVTGIRRDAKMTAGYGAVTLEYAIPVMQHVDVLVGLALGKGGIDLQLRKSNGTPDTWESEQAALKSDQLTTTGNVTRLLTSRFFVWSPSVSVEYAFLGWMGVRVGASYLGMSSPAWQADGNYDLLNVPSPVSGKGWTANLALLVGTF